MNHLLFDMNRVQAPAVTCTLSRTFEARAVACLLIHHGHQGLKQAAEVTSILKYIAVHLESAIELSLMILAALCEKFTRTRHPSPT